MNDHSVDELPTLENGKDKKLGTFHGVFRPTILTIIGVMMYLREGWLVGNAGLVGAILIILTAFFITGTTALSMSSIPDKPAPWPLAML